MNRGAGDFFSDSPTLRLIDLSSPLPKRYTYGLFKQPWRFMSSISSISFAAPLQAYSNRTEGNRAAQPKSEDGLTTSEKKQVEKLKKRDAEVRRHEQAHLTAAGSYAKGAPQYEYKEGPDGKQYAVGGHVEIDTSEVEGDPEATLTKARIIQRAALAPQEPSQQDQKVARQAAKMVQKAERELQEQKAEEAKTQAGGASGEHPGEAVSPDAPPQPIAQGYDRHGSPVVGPFALARINVFA